jgi:hypothetical protein
MMRIPIHVSTSVIFPMGYILIVSSSRRGGGGGLTDVRATSRTIGCRASVVQVCCNGVGAHRSNMTRLGTGRTAHRPRVVELKPRLAAPPWFDDRLPRLLLGAARLCSAAANSGPAAGRLFAWGEMERKA